MSKKGNHSCYPNMNADGMLSRLKRDRPELAQQVIEGELTATRAAREAEAWNLELFTICKKR